MEYFGAFLLGLAAATVGSIAAGGGLISIPGMILLGLSPVQAIATTRLNVVAGGVTSSYNYYRNRSISFKYLPLFIAISILAGVIGPKILLTLDQDLIKDFIGVSFLITLPLLIINKEFGVVSEPRSDFRKSFGFIAFFLIIVYGTMIGAGAGVLIIYALVYFFGMNITKSNATGLAASLIATVIAVILYANANEMVWRLGIPS
ncbi:MAG TPA: sulfite exporter TauE/SafE family protein, partial [Chitinophagaceae bacterium]|nr:sulfite exporter TauE/SafE family protein [Chitinophagaceae bacterium]